MYFEKSITTRDVAALAGEAGAAAARQDRRAVLARQTATVATTSSTSRGMTTPIGTCR